MAEKQYIEREVLIRHLNDEIKECGDACADFRPVTYGTILGFMEARSFANTLPAADVAPVVHGEWVDIFSLDNNENVIATCNYCKERGKVRTARNEWGVWYINSPRCPNCGAKMDGERKESTP